MNVHVYPAEAAMQVVLGDNEHVEDMLPSFMDSDTMRAIFVDGDFIFDGEGAFEMEELFNDLADQQPEGMLICAIVVTGNLHAPNAMLMDRDNDFAPSLIVGGNVIARNLYLGGGATKIVGDLTLQSTLFGEYNHGSLEVGGTTTAQLILSSDFCMDFHGAVQCDHIVSANGKMNIDAHFEDKAIRRILLPDLLDTYFHPIPKLVYQALEQNESLLLPKGRIGKKPPRTVSKAGRELLASLSADATAIDFDDCDLKFVPDEVANFPNLKWLDLERNSIRQLPASMKALQQLEVLNIASCGIEQLPDWLALLPKLRRLNVEGNDLTGLPDVPGGFAALEELEIGNPFTMSDEHYDWACSLQLDRFPALRSFSCHLSPHSTIRVYADSDAWYSPTLEHLHITPGLKGTMPNCLTRMPQLRSLALQIKKKFEESALEVFSRLHQVEAFQLNLEHRKSQFNEVLASVLTGASGNADRLPRFAAIRLAGDLRDKLDGLTEAAGAADDLPLKRERIGAAAQYATELLALYAPLSVPTMWRLDYSLGHLRIECLITLAWWMIRRDQPDLIAAADMLDDAERELALHGRNRAHADSHRESIAELRVLMA